MTKLLPLFFLLFLFSCQHDKREQVIHAVENHIKENMGDPASFETVGAHVDDNIDYKYPELNRRRDSLTSLLMGDKIDADLYSKTDSELVEQYKEKARKGWDVFIKFRGKNAFGAMILNEANFFVNTNMKVKPTD